MARWRSSVSVLSGTTSSTEDATIFNGYPAKRNWWPLSSDIYEEIVPSMGDAYPYPIKAVFSYMGTPVYALPAGHTNIEILADVNKILLKNLFRFFYSSNFYLKECCKI